VKIAAKANTGHAKHSLDKSQKNLFPLRTETTILTVDDALALIDFYIAQKARNAGRDSTSPSGA
jgi:hypothetical protein